MTDNNIEYTFGLYLKILLKGGEGKSESSRWTQQEFAKSIGRHVDTIGNWIRGRTVPNDFDMECIAKLLNLSIEGEKNDHWVNLVKLRNNFLISNGLQAASQKRTSTSRLSLVAKDLGLPIIDSQGALSPSAGYS